MDPQWNEIDIAFSNLTSTPLYGTSLFVSKQPFDYTTYDSNAGFGALQPKGLFRCVNMQKQHMPYTQLIYSYSVL